jgi:hypothetical protein
VLASLASPCVAAHNALHMRDASRSRAHGFSHARPLIANHPARRGAGALSSFQRFNACFYLCLRFRPLGLFFDAYSYACIFRTSVRLGALMIMPANAAASNTVRCTIILHGDTDKNTGCPWQ